ncbi:MULTISPECIES: flavin reductase family protein [Kribbella]|jgi:flavin reductase (DIM6/NTAB) family NADH-FMN oxidoreductase RutF|uniref:Flavin reductase (DIM6/NTAB) family NADH-FMN oxidoreductase RutF n=1 Tax=Kribbella pratensis TaxID=2512112 RepID=A0ABY2FEQ5_9ACTN|nr:MULTISPECIES: flavin reductase family protein [Kribbella]TDW89853.1 flavin reductase (DIM6/NTAB) family NADH-FMN oxidoreductase RutF [Kribbella pratensis]TDX08915.1 flavin reductase (DIM6/NTAB) family NADH-FMN oxidoreductase RutF [Kribbella sp. VKM Ac-2566]
MSVPALNRPALAVVPDRSEERIVDADVYRSVFRRHAAGVVVITADSGHGPVGFTATSLVSISLLPPLVSFAIATSASSWPTVSTASSVVINFLSADQHAIAGRFATSGIDRFAEPTRWSRLATGEPALDDAPSFLRAQIAHRFAVGDHYLVVARLATHTERREHEPLLYHDGRYAKAHHV